MRSTAKSCIVDSQSIAGYPCSMTKKKSIVLLIILASLIVAGALLFYFLRPSVAFIRSDLFPSGYELPGPSALRYRLTGNPIGADLVIVSPDAAVPPGVPAYLFGREAEDGETVEAVLAIDNGRMWEQALRDTEIALLYEESSVYGREVADYLSSIDGNVRSVTYTGRISGANIETVRKEIAGAGIVFALTPSSSVEILRSAHSWPVVMDIRDAAAMETTAVDEAVSIDWNKTVENLLAGRAELSYCLVAM